MKRTCPVYEKQYLRLIQVDEVFGAALRRPKIKNQNVPAALAASPEEARVMTVPLQWSATGHAGRDYGFLRLWNFFDGIANSCRGWRQELQE